MKERTFEESLKDLENIVISMESGSMPLEESIKKYEDGIKLVRFCKDRLEKAEKKIEILVKKSDGSVALEDFDKAVQDDNNNQVQSRPKNIEPEAIQTENPVVSLEKEDVKKPEKTVKASISIEAINIDNCDEVKPEPVVEIADKPKKKEPQVSAKPKNDNFEDLLF